MPRRKRYTRSLGRQRLETVPTRGTGTRFVRFAHATEPYGVFSYLSDARHSMRAARASASPDHGFEWARDLDELEALVAWFGEHLEAPARMVPLVYRPEAEDEEAEDDDDRARGVCWFRADAVKHVDRARRLALLVRRAGIDIREQWRDEPRGQVCSEDDVQVVFAPIWA